DNTAHDAKRDPAKRDRPNKFDHRLPSPKPGRFSKALTKTPKPTLATSSLESTFASNRNASWTCESIDKPITSTPIKSQCSAMRRTPLAPKSQFPSVTAKIILRLAGARAHRRLAHSAMVGERGVEPCVLDAALANRACTLSADKRAFGALIDTTRLPTKRTISHLAPTCSAACATTSPRLAAR